MDTARAVKAMNMAMIHKYRRLFALWWVSSVEVLVTDILPCTSLSSLQVKVVLLTLTSGASTKETSTAVLSVAEETVLHPLAMGRQSFVGMFAESLVEGCKCLESSESRADDDAGRRGGGGGGGGDRSFKDGMSCARYLAFGSSNTCLTHLFVDAPQQGNNIYMHLLRPADRHRHAVSHFGGSRLQS